MKVVRINKYSRNCEQTLYLILRDGQYEDPESEKYYVEEFCSLDPAGSSYGWRCEWEDETDPNKIKEIVEKEIDKLILSSNINSALIDEYSKVFNVKIKKKVNKSTAENLVSFVERFCNVDEVTIKDAEEWLANNIYE